MYNDIVSPSEFVLYMKNDKCFRVAIIGSGRMAQLMVNSIKKAKGISVVAIAARDCDRAKEFAKKNGISLWFGSYDELIRCDEYDLIYIATVNSTHYEIARMCLNNRRPVLVEKPICLNSEQVKSLVKLSKANNTFLAEAMPLRYSPNMKKIHKYIENGAMGSVNLLTSNIGITNWGIDRICSKDLGGGALYDLGVYGLTLADMILNNGELYGIEAEATYDNYVDSDNAVIISYKKARAICYNSVKHKTDCFAKIYGDKGVILVIKAFNAELVICYAGLKLFRVFRGRKNCNYYREVEACWKAMSEGMIETADYNHADMIRISEMLEQTAKSMS